MKFCFLACIVSIILILRHEAYCSDIKDRAKSKYSKLKDKIKQLKKSTFRPRSTNIYPGYNITATIETLKLWDKHYECLTDRHKILTTIGSVLPHAKVAFRGMKISLSCGTCFPPDTNQNVVIWKRKQASKLEAELIKVDGNHFFISPDMHLTIENVELEDTGHYECFYSGFTQEVHHLEVKKLTELQMVHTEKATKGPYAQGDAELELENLKVVTEWSDWSPCTQCDRVGRKVRYGVCVVKKIDPSVPVKSAERGTLFDLFYNGIPCSASILPEELHEDELLHTRKNQVMTSYCKPECKREGLFVVKDLRGNPIEIANNSDGHYAYQQGFPRPPKETKRKSLFVEEDQAITLSCPGSATGTGTIVWQVDGKDLDSWLAFTSSAQRIVLDFRNLIHIKTLKVSDSGTYSCWRDKKLIATIKVKVSEKKGFGWRKFFILLAVIYIALFFYKLISTLIKRGYRKKLR